MAYLNKELQERINNLSPLNKKLLEQFLLDINAAKLESEKRDAVTRLRSKIREIVAAGENK
ncbi:hypothetical protein ACFWDG_11655 [Peribacillus sp. NPDC060186]|uniref:hypothetical protein n=1 Tax=Bacillus TaxID=1386 RepID=UPI002E1DF493|nr:MULTISPECIES: hypothetical protein [Bacillus cereus group]MED0988416.1 hypothetical protein [Bacillus nitratireducens]MED1511843.1 hypothetical protein [Bacillus proteolyticus]